MGDTITLFAPDGTLGEVPMAQMQAALKAGAKPAITVKAPDGSLGHVPADRLTDAVKAGASVVPIQEQENQQPGFWHSLWSDVQGMASGIKHLNDYDPMTDPKLSQEQKMQIVNQNFAEADAQNAARQKAGYGPVYRNLAAPAAEMMGVNVPGMEQSAAQGDVAGVAGHAAAVPAVLAATEGAARVLPRVATMASEKAPALYQSALKPSRAIPAAKTAAMVQTGLEQAIPVSPAGVEKLGSLIDDLNDKIAQQIQTDPTRPINKFAVTSRLADTAKSFATQVNPEADLNAVSESGNEFLRNQPAQIAAENAQALKQGTYKQLRSKYGELQSATIESQKALARGLKEELANAFPELANLNAQDAKLYNLQEPLEKAVQRIGNHQLLGIGTPIAGGAAKAMTGSTTLATIAAALKFTVDNPIVKSRLAIALSRADQLTLPAAQQRVAAYLAGLDAASGGAANNATPADRETGQASQ